MAGTAGERQRLRPQPRLPDPVAVRDEASVAIMQKWLPPEVLDHHGYVTPTLIEATTKPHNPSIEYDLWLKWNQAADRRQRGRDERDRAGRHAAGQRLVRRRRRCRPPGPGSVAGGGPPGPAVAEGWDDWGPFYTPMYAQHIGLDGSTVEMCNQTDTALRRARVDDAPARPRGRPMAQYTVVCVDARVRRRPSQRDALRRGSRATAAASTDAPRVRRAARRRSTSTTTG